MNVFLSWSGARSQSVARAFHEWLPSVIQQIDPWISTDSISKGEVWLSNIRQALLDSNGFGLFFLTREAITSEWLLFEAGGIASMGMQRVCTVCIDLEPHDLRPPLSFFQATRLERSDVERLLEDLNKQLARPLAPKILARAFERAWPDLAPQLESSKQIQAEVPKAKATVPAQSDDRVLDALRRVEARLGALERAGENEVKWRPGNVARMVDVVKMADLNPFERLALSASGDTATGGTGGLGSPHALLHDPDPVRPK